MRNGYILLHRQGLTPDEWKHPLRTLAWIDFLTMAAYEDFTAPDGVFVRRAEVIASYGFLAKRWRVSKDTAFNWVKHWIAERQVERRPERCAERSAERFFVVNYAKYQDSAERVAERPSERTTERPAEQMKGKEIKQDTKKKTEERPREVSLERTDERSTEKIEPLFKRIVVEQQWCDEAYADKTWEQGSAMPERSEFIRKVRLMLAWANTPSRLGRAKLLFHEIAGFVNDRGAMQSKLTTHEIEARRLFREETGQSLDEA